MKETGNRRNRDSFRKNAAFLIFLVFVSVIRIWLAVGTPVYIVYAVQDDQLLMKHSAAMLQFEWLGEYIGFTRASTTKSLIPISLASFTKKPDCPSKRAIPSTVGTEPSPMVALCTLPVASSPTSKESLKFHSNKCNLYLKLNYFLPLLHLQY